MSKHLEIGPGEDPLKGEWDTLDAQPGPRVSIVGKWGYERLPISDDTYDLIFASHVIEHIPWYQVDDALKEVFRILKPGGSFEVWTVNFYHVVQHYLKKQRVGKWTCQNRIKHWMHSISGRIFAYEKHGNPFMWHKSLFDRPYLHHCLKQAGFVGIEDLKKTRGPDHGSINMGVKGVKPK